MGLFNDVIVVERRSLEENIILSNSKECYIVKAPETTGQFRAWINKLFKGGIGSKILDPNCYRNEKGHQVVVSAFTEAGPRNLLKKLKKTGCKFYTV